MNFEKFKKEITSEAPVAIRDLLAFSTKQPIPIAQVEPIEDIRRRFTTAAMSLGAISPEAHEAIAGSTWAEMKGVGHFPMSENPEAFVGYLLPILDDIASAAA